MFKRISLFLAVNIAITATLSLIVTLLGGARYMTQAGLDYSSLAIFCMIWGFGGSFISLLMSKFIAKMSMGVKIIPPNENGPYGSLVQRVHTLCRQASLTKMPEVGVFQNPSPNAFATGPSQSHALVAVSTGLLQNMNNEQVDAVLAHEIAHIKNGDMVTLTLIQGTVNAFTMFLSRIVGFAITQGVKEENRAGIMMLVTFVLDLVFGFIGMAIVCRFSRWREFRADRGSANILGTPLPMISALQNLAQAQGHLPPPEKTSLAALQISGKSGGLMSFFATHPPLEDRIAALQRAS